MENERETERGRGRGRDNPGTPLAKIDWHYPPLSLSLSASACCNAGFLHSEVFAEF
jgi:hypothetical protein